MENNFVNLTLLRQNKFTISSIIECENGNSPCEPTSDGLEILKRKELINFAKDYKKLYGKCTYNDLPDVNIVHEEDIQVILNEISNKKYIDSSRHYFIVRLAPKSGEFGHRISFLKEGNRIYILDFANSSLANEIFYTVKSYFQKFGYSVSKIETKLQYNSIACETFAYKVPFLIERCIAFNKGDYKDFSDFLESKKSKTKVNLKSDSVLLLLNEKEFCNVKDLRAQLLSRKNKLYEKNKDIKYSKEIFMVDELTKYDDKDCEQSINNFTKIYKNYQQTAPIRVVLGGYMHNTAMNECRDIIGDGLCRKKVSLTDFQEKIASLNNELETVLLHENEEYEEPQKTIVSSEISKANETLESEISDYIIIDDYKTKCQMDNIVSINKLKFSRNGKNAINNSVENYHNDLHIKG